jgi:TonB family protein
MVRPLTSASKPEIGVWRRTFLNQFDRRLLLAGIVLSLPFNPARGAQTLAPSYDTAYYLQNSVAGTPLGKLNVAPGNMAARCITMVSPNYPQTTGDSPARASVVVRVVVWKSGTVSPLRVTSGPTFLEAEAMNVVRLWRYKPFPGEGGEPVDVTTEVTVNFDRGKPGGTVSHPHN